MKFSSLKELIVYMTLVAGVGASALGTSLATNDALPTPRVMVVSTPAPHGGPHDHAHDPFGHAVEEHGEVTIDLAYGARATDASGDVAVSRRSLHAHAVQGEDGTWELERLDQVRVLRDERYTTSTPGVWERAELAGELPHSDGEHDHAHNGHDHAAEEEAHGGVLDHLGHPLTEGERQVDTAFQVKVAGAEGEAIVARGGSHQHWKANDAGTRELERSEPYFEVTREGPEAEVDEHGHAHDHDHVHN